MTDTIYRADAIEAFPKITLADIGFATKAEYRAEAIENINALPSAEAVQGEWGHMIADGEDGSHWYEYECSHCGEVVLRPYNFCPNCGAKMFREDGEV